MSKAVLHLLEIVPELSIYAPTHRKPTKQINRCYIVIKQWLSASLYVSDGKMACRGGGGHWLVLNQFEMTATKCTAVKAVYPCGAS